MERIDDYLGQYQSFAKMFFPAIKTIPKKSGVLFQNDSHEQETKLVL